MISVRRARLVRSQVTWMLTVLVILAALDMLSLTLFFSASLVGFLVVVELMGSVTLTPQWQSRLYWIGFAGLVVFVGLLIREISNLLPPWVVPF